MTTPVTTQDPQELTSGESPSTNPTQDLLTEIEKLHKLLLKDAEEGGGS